jgi:predicted TIM-barrel fold metal-dependent hydrolase
MPEIRGIMRNVYYDTAASLYLYQDDIFSLAARWAPGKVLFATDYPLITPKRFIRRLGAARMPTATRRRMLGGNAWRVLKLGDRPNPDQPALRHLTPDTIGLTGGA